MKLHFYLFALIAVALAACGKAGVSSTDIATREVRDDLGQTVKVPAKIDRAISLAPNLTEMIFAVGAGDKLVGVTSYCNYPPEAKKLEKIGDTQTPNIEKIIALKPQVVFVSTASGSRSWSVSVAGTQAFVDPAFPAAGVVYDSVSGALLKSNVSFSGPT